MSAEDMRDPEKPDAVASLVIPVGSMPDGMVNDLLACFAQKCVGAGFQVSITREGNLFIGNAW